MDWNSKRILVVGAKTGMGRAIADRFTALGARVVRGDLAAEDWPEMDTDVTVDVADPRSVEAGVSSSVASLKGLDVVVHCAGILGPVSPVLEADLADVRRIIEIDLLGAYFVAKSVLPHLLNSSPSRLIFIASIAGKEGNPGMAAYSAAKAGVIGLTKALSKEHVRDGLTVNAVAPASIETPLLAGMTAERRAVQQALMPIGRFGTPYEAAALVEFIASDAAGFTTGFVFDLSGGRATY